jgi:hypothetical protein
MVISNNIDNNMKNMDNTDTNDNVNTMRILDLDLDFFLNKIVFWKKNNKRLNEKDYIPWKKDKLINFLENQCNLSKDNKIDGKIVKKHHEAFYFWNELINNNKLKTPFEVVHVDAHADLGMGDNSYNYIIGELLKIPPQKRNNPQHINEGNYLAFAIANRWISKLKYITHPLGGNDILKEYLIDNEITNNIKLNNDEPVVEFEKIQGKNYIDNGKYFDYIVLSISPRYTPKRADKLIPVFKKYINEI